jgi:hypothetical protein
MPNYEERTGKRVANSGAANTYQNVIGGSYVAGGEY